MKEWAQTTIVSILIGLGLATQSKCVSKPGELGNRRKLGLWSNPPPPQGWGSQSVCLHDGVNSCQLGHETRNGNTGKCHNNRTGWLKTNRSRQAETERVEVTLGTGLPAPLGIWSGEGRRWHWEGKAKKKQSTGPGKPNQLSKAG